MYIYFKEYSCFSCLCFTFHIVRININLIIITAIKQTNCKYKNTSTRLCLGKHKDSQETKQMFPSWAVIKCFHKQNKPQLLTQNKFITRIRVGIQTYSNSCGILSVYGVFFNKHFSNFNFRKMSKTFLWGLHFCFCMKTVQIATLNF